MARRLISTVVRMRGGATLGYGTRLRIYDDEALTTLSTIYRRSTGVGTQPNPLLPNAGMQTALTVNAAAVDTTITVAATAGFQVGDLIPIRNTTTTKYRVITVINSVTGVITLDSALGAVFNVTDTMVGAPEMRGHIWGWLETVVDPFAEAEDIASGHRSPPLQIPLGIPAAALTMQEQGGALGQFTVVNYLGTAITAADAGAGVLNVTVGGDFTDQSFIKIGTNPATIGAIRLPNDVDIEARNAANTANGRLARLASDDVIYIGDSAFAIVKIGNGAAGAAVAIGLNPAAAGILRIPNAQYIYSRNDSNTNDGLLIGIDASNNIITGNGQVNLLWHKGLQGIAIGATPATTGAIRLPNAGQIAARNAANSTDMRLIELTAGDIVFVSASGQPVTIGGTATIQGAFASIGGTPAAAGTIRLPTGATISNRNAGNTADEQIWPHATAEADLGGNVAMTTANTFYDGPSVSLTPGKWLITGTVTVSPNNLNGTITAKLWDGTTVESSTAQEQAGTAVDVSLSLSGIVTVAATTTWKISVTNNTAGGNILAAAAANGAGNNASHIRAVRIG